MPIPNWIGSRNSVANWRFMCSTFEATIGRGPNRLPARGCRIGMKPEQGKQTIADELVWLPPAVHYRLRGRLQEAIDQEYGIEWQARLCEPGRSAHVDEHADDIALLADMNALAIADEIGTDIGWQHRNHRYIGLRSELTGDPDRRVAGSANAPTHQPLATGRPRQSAAVANDANTAGRAPRPASADAGGRHIEPQAVLQNTPAPGHAHSPGRG